MRAAGTLMARNEIAAIEFCVWHHLDQGLEKMYIVDNGSKDGTAEAVMELAKKDSRVEVVPMFIDFHQQIVFTELARKAHAEGFDWVVPMDADELWYSDNKLVNDLPDIPEHIGGLEIVLENYIAPTSQQEDEADVFEKVLYRSVQFERRLQQDPTLLTTMLNVGAMSSVEIPWSSKFIFRPHAEIGLSIGAHHITTIGGPLSDPRFKIAHVPMRSYKHLTHKAIHGLRLIQAGHGPGTGWEAQRWFRMLEDGTLPSEWKGNSQTGGKMTRINGSVAPLIKDDYVSKRYLEFKCA